MLANLFNKIHQCREPTCGWMVDSGIPVHQCSSPILGTDARNFLDLFEAFLRCSFSEKIVAIDYSASMVSLSILKMLCRFNISYVLIAVECACMHS